MSEEPLKVRLSNMLLAEYPGLKTGVTRDNAEAAHDMASVLGCLMGCVLYRQPDDYVKALQEVIKVIDQNARETASLAGDITQSRQLTKH